MKKRSVAGTTAAILVGSFALAGSHGVVTYTGHIKPIMEKQCLSCHGEDSSSIDEFDANKEKYKEMMLGPRMDSYDLLVDFVKGDDAGAIMRRLDNGENTQSGKPGNMYEYLGGSEEERELNLELFKRWVGHWTLKRAAELTDEDQKLFNVVEQP
ncbi:MAG: hypothetical protein SCH98_07525 [Deferrisomatales bacterium]|nr:hypothetical protein [Deferrisomatales bacterium]